jgi:hypothetical protein
MYSKGPLLTGQTKILSSFLSIITPFQDKKFISRPSLRQRWQ